MTSPAAFVVDASVGIKLVLSEALSEQADAVFAHLAADPPGQLSVPDLFYVECANILWKHTRRSGLPMDAARKALTDIGKLALRSYPTGNLVLGALDIAGKEGITAYDASYVALARLIEVPFVTADEKLARALTGKRYRVVWLGDFALPPTQARPEV
jgi:predicted nucleic acid-binding protein